MANVNLTTLIKAAPLKEETQKELLTQANTFNPDQKYEIESILWARIALLFSAELQKRTNELTLAEVKGGNKVSENDLVEIELKLTREFAEKLESASTEEEVGKVREEIGKYLQKPFVQDPQK